MKVRSIKHRYFNQYQAARAERPKFATKFVVYRKKDDAEVGSFFDEDVANTLVAKAKASKKASLYVKPTTVQI